MLMLLVTPVLFLLQQVKMSMPIEEKFKAYTVTKGVYIGCELHSWHPTIMYGERI